MAKPRTKEYKAFTDALGKVLTVSHDEMKQMLKNEQVEKKRKPKTSASGRASRAKKD
jgi:hypothetical protein